MGRLEKETYEQWLDRQFARWAAEDEKRKGVK